MATMKTIHTIIEELEEMFPGGTVNVDFDSGKYGEVVFTIRTGLVEPADGQQVHTIEEVTEILEG